MSRSDGYVNIAKTNEAAAAVNALNIEALIEATELLGSVRMATKHLKIDARNLKRYYAAHPEVAERLRDAQERGRPARILWLQAKLEEHIEAMNITALIFELKRMDPSYRDSYSVHTTNTPVDFVVDLSAPAESPTQLTDVTTTGILGE